MVMRTHRRASGPGAAPLALRSRGPEHRHSDPGPSGTARVARQPKVRPSARSTKNLGQRPPQTPATTVFRANRRALRRNLRPPTRRPNVTSIRHPPRFSTACPPAAPPWPHCPNPVQSLLLCGPRSFGLRAYLTGRDSSDVRDRCFRGERPGTFGLPARSTQYSSRGRRTLAGPGARPAQPPATVHCARGAALGNPARSKGFQLPGRMPARGPALAARFPVPSKAPSAGHGPVSRAAGFRNVDFASWPSSG